MLTFSHITVRFGREGTPNAIDDISLDVNEKEKVFLIGETGSGKSVLLMAVLGMLPESAAVFGEAILDGKNILGLSQKELRHIRGTEIAYIPQGSGNGMNPLLKVGYQVGEPLMIHEHMKKKSVIARVIEQLKSFDLGKEESIVKSYPHMLSGGMKQRSLIAMGVMENAPILFADEPTKGLDQERIQTVADCFEKLTDKTIICVTHDLRFARKAANTICVLYSSETIEIAPKEEFFLQPLHPYSRAIIDALPENGLKVSEGFAPPREGFSGGCRYAKRCRFCTKRCEKRPPLIEKDGRKVRCWLYAD